MKPVTRISLVLLFSLLAVFSCGPGQGGEVRAQGVVDGDVLVLKAKVAGTLETFFLVEGQRVRRGEIAGEVDGEKVQKQLEEARLNREELALTEAKLVRRKVMLMKNRDFLTRQVRRFERLDREDAIPGEKLEQMRLKLEEALTREHDLNQEMNKIRVQEKKLQTREEYLNLLLADHRIRIPVNGVVLECLVTGGETLFPGTSLAEILVEESLYIEVFLEAEEIAPLDKGARVQIQVDGYPGPLQGRITYFGRTAEFSPKYIITEKERKSLLYRVKVRVKEEDRRALKLGMLVTVGIAQDD